MGFIVCNHLKFACFNLRNHDLIDKFLDLGHILIQKKGTKKGFKGITKNGVTIATTRFFFPFTQLDKLVKLAITRKTS
ncbi:Uncharacterised protein [Streptococcus pneumoniae]|nr:Uncharacterised protein [Streptococcus pneumoniae]